MVRLVYQRADGCCEYCQTCENNIGQPMHVEHIDPNSGNHPDNLCLSCAACNLSKARATTAKDPETNEIVLLFNPCKQKWHDNFMCLNDGLFVQGLTATGRATVLRLRMNLDRVVSARRVWIRGGGHPPQIK